MSQHSRTQIRAALPHLFTTRKSKACPICKLPKEPKSKAEPKQQTMAGPDRKDSPKPPQERMLSAVSKQYDFDGDGKLDEAEQAL